MEYISQSDLHIKCPENMAISVSRGLNFPHIIIQLFCHFPINKSLKNKGQMRFTTFPPKTRNGIGPSMLTRWGFFPHFIE